MALHVFALTGGLGSGKSTVLARFVARGLPVVNADELARSVVEPGQPALAELARVFGPDVLDARGALDRRRLAERAFADPNARKALEAITHPRIAALAAERFRALDAQGEPLACYEVPLLFEVGLDRKYRPIVVVTAPEAERIARAMRRDGTTERHVRARLAAQLPLDDKVARADFVIDNGGPLEDTLRQADRVLDAICERVGVDPARYPVPA